MAKKTKKTKKTNKTKKQYPKLYKKLLDDIKVIGLTRGNISLKQLNHSLENLSNQEKSIDDKIDPTVDQHKNFFLAALYLKRIILTQRLIEQQILDAAYAINLEYCGFICCEIEESDLESYSGLVTKLDDSVKQLRADLKKLKELYSPEKHSYDFVFSVYLYEALFQVSINLSVNFSRSSDENVLDMMVERLLISKIEDYNAIRFALSDICFKLLVIQHTKDLDYDTYKRSHVYIGLIVDYINNLHNRGLLKDREHEQARDIIKRIVNKVLDLYKRHPQEIFANEVACDGEDEIASRACYLIMILESLKKALSLAVGGLQTDRASMNIDLQIKKAITTYHILITKCHKLIQTEFGESIKILFFEYAVETYLKALVNGGSDAYRSFHTYDTIEATLQYSTGIFNDIATKKSKSQIVLEIPKKATVEEKEQDDDGKDMEVGPSAEEPEHITQTGGKEWEENIRKMREMALAELLEEDDEHNSKVRETFIKKKNKIEERRKKKEAEQKKKQLEARKKKEKRDAERPHVRVQALGITADENFRDAPFVADFLGLKEELRLLGIKANKLTKVVITINEKCQAYNSKVENILSDNVELPYNKDIEKEGFDIKDYADGFDFLDKFATYDADKQEQILELSKSLEDFQWALKVQKRIDGLSPDEQRSRIRDFIADVVSLETIVEERLKYHTINKILTVAHAFNNDNETVSMVTLVKEYEKIADHLIDEIKIYLESKKYQDLPELEGIDDQIRDVLGGVLQALRVYYGYSSEVAKVSFHRQQVRKLWCDGAERIQNSIEKTNPRKNKIEDLFSRLPSKPEETLCAASISRIPHNEILAQRNVRIEVISTHVYKPTVSSYEEDEDQKKKEDSKQIDGQPRVLDTQPRVLLVRESRHVDEDEDITINENPPPAASSRDDERPGRLEELEKLLKRMSVDNHEQVVAASHEKDVVAAGHRQSMVQWNDATVFIASQSQSQGQPYPAQTLAEPQVQQQLITHLYPIAPDPLYYNPIGRPNPDKPYDGIVKWLEFLKRTSDTKDLNKGVLSKVFLCACTQGDLFSDNEKINTLNIEIEGEFFRLSRSLTDKKKFDAKIIFDVEGLINKIREGARQEKSSQTRRNHHGFGCT